MIFNADDDICPCHVYDANGLELFWCVEVDTEIGRVDQLKTNEDGCILQSPYTEDVLHEIKFYAAPLLVVPYKPGEPGPATPFFAYEGCTCKVLPDKACPLNWKHEQERRREESFKRLVGSKNKDL